MPISINQEMMREIIMDHYSNPRNFREEKDPAYKTVYMDSTSCIDKIYVQAKIENNILVEIHSYPRTHLMDDTCSPTRSELLKGKTVNEANEIIKNYLAMIHEEEYNPDLLDEAIVFMNTSRQAARIKCATIGWNGMSQILEGKK